MSAMEKIERLVRVDCGRRSLPEIDPEADMHAQSRRTVERAAVKLALTFEPFRDANLRIGHIKCVPPARG
jgi:hypothetical protein